MLAQALRPFILRRTKAQVARDLPEKVEQTLFCQLEPAQRTLYNELRDHYRQSLLNRIEQDGMDKSKIHILEALLRLRQAAIHPGLIDLRAHPNPAPNWICCFRSWPKFWKKATKPWSFRSSLPCSASCAAGWMSRRSAMNISTDRHATAGLRSSVSRTIRNAKLFLISLKAGGLGLNLTAAEYVFLLDPWWNPAVEAQAIDRTHRIGQTRSVFAYRLIAKDTVEEKVLELQETKREIADAIISQDNSLLRNLRSEDLAVLLS